MGDASVAAKQVRVDKWQNPGWVWDTVKRECRRRSPSRCDEGFGLHPTSVPVPQSTSARVIDSAASRECMDNRVVVGVAKAKQRHVRQRQWLGRDRLTIRVEQ
ncbi:hypothetical protein BASA81_016405 [Batrachochytrium salamandrivorans]|nr:hypothetical protein BASA81_016405 [Batrachochytrium salamandrivorans]